MYSHTISLWTVHLAVLFGTFLAATAPITPMNLKETPPTKTIPLGPNTRPLPMPWEKWPFSEENPFYLEERLQIVKPYSPKGNKLCTLDNCCLLGKKEKLTPKCFWNRKHGFRKTYGKHKGNMGIKYGFYEGIAKDFLVWEKWKPGKSEFFSDWI
ncbi:hypothetical protein K470DRAFT_257921, partial [Piedraia hortae CBS 480.64]